MLCFRGTLSWWFRCCWIQNINEWLDLNYLCSSGLHWKYFQRNTFLASLLGFITTNNTTYGPRWVMRIAICEIYCSELLRRVKMFELHKYVLCMCVMSTHVSIFLFWFLSDLKENSLLLVHYQERFLFAQIHLYNSLLFFVCRNPVPNTSKDCGHLIC